MKILNLLYKKSREVNKSDIEDVYTYLAYNKKLKNYRIITGNDLISEPKIERGTHLPAYLFDFILSSGKILMICNGILNEINEITLRSLKEKKFMDFGEKKALPYGLFNFKNFKYNDPIVIVEGFKDCDCFKEIYPFTIACRTAGTSILMREVISTLTKRVILAYDNDSAGINAIKNDRLNFKKLKIDAVALEHPNFVKDIGEIADSYYKGNTFQSDYLINFYKTQIDVLIN